MTGEVLSRDGWQACREQHLNAVYRWTGPFRERRGRGESHGVYDFLFTYYSLSTRKLEEWHPGYGVELELGDDAESEIYGSDRHYKVTSRGVTVDPSRMRESLRRQLLPVREICQTIADRRPRFSCFGLHEWAMVYAGEEKRHAYPLRLPQSEVDRFVEANVVQCSHFDAFRFFTSKAAPLNILQPTADTRLEHEQGGCLHANMDLYKWSGKLLPFVSSDLVRRCFELALEARELDMRASPYDIVALGFAPILLETETGRAEYLQEQRRISDCAATLRSELVLRVEELIRALSINADSNTGEQHIA